MAVLIDLANELASLAQVDASENITSGDLENYVTLALRQHDKFMSIDMLPVEEEEPVLTLAWAKVCLVRAGKLAMDANLSGAAGFGKDASNPYNKNMALSKSLIERYGQLCNMLRVDKQRVVIGTIFVRDNIYDAMLPLLQAINPPDIGFTFVGIPQTSDTTVVLRWAISNFSDYYQLYVYQMTGDTPIFAEWNFQSGTGTPKVLDGATRLFMTLDFTQNALKVTDLDRTVTNRFLVVLRSRSNKYAYGPELVLLNNQNTPPAPPSSAVHQVNSSLWNGSDANGNVVGSPGDLCILMPSKGIQVKMTGIANNTGWV